MSRISTVMQRRSADQPIRIIPYVTPEFPVPGTTVPLVLALEKIGAAMVEIGIPFSDPLADGPTIQHASDIALRNGVTIPKVFEFVGQIRKSSQIPVILMGYVNPILQYGIDRFFSDGKKAGIDGVIIPDLPPEESDEVQSACRRYGIGITYLIAPTSTEERIRFIDDQSTDFSYCVSVTGVTGARSGLPEGLNEFLSTVKRNAKKPFVVGFGIKNREHVRQIAPIADGIVIGSALIDAIGKGTDVDSAVRLGEEFFRSLQ
jgi:tryptophan synthase alpha chain